MQTQTHELTFTDSVVRKRFVTWADGEPDREWGCLTLIWENAPGVAPRPLRRELDGSAPVVVMERLPGEPLGAGPLSPEQTRSLGRALRQVFSIPVERIVAAGITERRYGPSSLPELLTEWLEEPYDLSKCTEPRRVALGVEAALDWLASANAIPVPHLAGLGIADLNPANILWDGRACRLVDFEDGGLTDPAYDLADHVEHLASRLSSVFDPEALADAVGLTDAERLRMHAYRPLWAAFWLAMLLPGNGGFARNPPGTTEAQVHHLIKLIG